MTQTVSAPPSEAAPQSLFGGSRTLYRGTDIDGATIEPNEGLWVRGSNLNELIGHIDFASALWRVWLGGTPAPAVAQAVDAALDAVAESMPGQPCLAAVRAVAASGAGMVQAAACGFLADLSALERVARAEAAARGLPDGDDFIQGLVGIAAAPAMLAAAMGQGDAIVGGASHAERALAAMGSARRDTAARRAVDALLVAWHAGFGYITPTVLVPRTAIGTGVTLPQALAAGFMASGPKHVGAAEEALAWLKSIGPDASDEAVFAAVDLALDSPGQLLFGFGHPLFVEDPRPPHIRALFAEWGFEGPHIRLFDLACRRALERKGLRPNIDFITAAALLDLGVSEPRWGVGLGLCARVAAMVAHAIERRDRPAFGVSSKAARKLLATVPVGWL
ncbi:citrate/2-methylcitrate synthase [Chromobacterium paludis]|uniref:citrate synthase (unknown stereospecificity) n=1 Tax=Chromobacterium paludis TaxID=2605945 RepID=A0A5C1DDI7_9NEIS|nr:citrate/2-methylcitrate synthase [Chromobacterium paludis]QEL54795.1 citrate/2-methylcitrate synthase [Chromobacterium paludis]